MARRRMIDPNIWQSEDFATISVLARLVFIGMFSNADDDGRGRAKPVYLKSILFPYDDNLKAADIENALGEIGAKMSVVFYDHDDNQYYAFTNWTKWQRVDKPQMSKLPEPTNIRECAANDIGRGSPKGKEAKGKEKNIKEDKISSVFKAALEYLNQQTGKKFRLTDTYKSHMNARVDEGATLDDFKTVVDNKVKDWGHAPTDGQKDMRKYLRPETLFGTKFQTYLNESATSPPLTHDPTTGIKFAN